MASGAAAITCTIQALAQQGGHGTTLGGVIVDSGKFDWKASGRYAPIAAPNPSYHGVSFADAAGPAENTKKVVEYPANHPRVEKVNHPSLPGHPDHSQLSPEELLDQGIKPNTIRLDFMRRRGRQIT